MKVLIAVHHFPPRYTGGAEWRAYRTASALQARGHEVRVICVERIDSGPKDGLRWEDEIYDGVAVRRLSFNLAATPDPFHWEYDNLWIGRHLQGVLSEYRPELFHLIGGYLISGRALHVAREFGIPTVLTLTDFWFLCRRISMLRSDNQISTLPLDSVTCARCLGEEQPNYRRLGQIAPGLMNIFWRLQTGRIRDVQRRIYFLRETLNQVNIIISPSQFLRSMFIQAGVDPARIVFLRQGRDFPNLKAETLAKPPAPVLRLGYAGQIAPIKGVHLIFEAAKQMPEAPLTVKAYGDTMPFPYYTAQLRRLIGSDKRLELAGVYGRNDTSRIMRDLDIIVMPSLWYENSPNVILEAFAHRIPVIAADLGGMSELVNHNKNGLLFVPGDASDLARQLRRVLAEPELLPRLRAGIGSVKTVAEEMDEIESVYRQIADLAQKGALA